MKRSSVAYYFARIESPIGPLLVAAGPLGVLRIQFGDDESKFRQDLAAQCGVEALRDDRALAEVRRALRDYFARRSEGLDFAADLSSVPDFQRRVLEVLRQVPYGQVVSYGELARRAGKPGAARAVGRAMGSNPLPLLYPCHRVVAHDGTLGGFGGGLPMKRVLLELEGALLPLSRGRPRAARQRAPRPPAQARPRSRRKPVRA